MEKKVEVWAGSWLTERDDLDKLKATRDWVLSWNDEEATKVFTVPINFYRFFVQFKDMMLVSYLFDTWAELTGTLYDNHIAVSAEAGYVNEDLSIHVLKYDNVTVGYAAKSLNDTTVYAHLSSRYEITASLVEK